MKFDCREDIVQLTPLWKGDRFENGRPKAPKDTLERLRRVTLEEAWATLWRRDYMYQFEGDLKRVHADKVMVGRAVTSVMVPKRPDLNDCLLEYGHEKEGRVGFFNQWVVDSLVEDDVLVVDLFDKIAWGTYVGGNLSTAVASRAKRGGSVIWGGIRDVQQVEGIDAIQTYYRGNDPTPIKDVTMVGFNTPCRIGKAVCMPGDVVMGTSAGVLFIPPHLAEEAATSAEKAKARDMFGFARLSEGTYTTAQVDRAWTVAIMEDFVRWFETEGPPEYRHLTWEKEMEAARKREAEGGGPKGQVGY